KLCFGFLLWHPKIYLLRTLLLKNDQNGYGLQREKPNTKVSFALTREVVENKDGQLFPFQLVQNGWIHGLGLER
ncbi:MAG: hypothetical protein IH886_08940, partial [Nitrospinae bacterium]|nr:hypothetical protein [Nitrospinota bacterium]